MDKVLVVFGANGQQGGSVIDVVLNDSELSQEYKIRAITRDTSSSSSKALADKGCEVVAADPNDASSLPAAMKGADTVFAMNFPDFKDIKGSELRQGHVMVDTALAEGVRFYIFSTLPHVVKISDGKYTKVAGFDAKAEVEEYIRSKPIKSAFFAPGSFMQNYHTVMKPRKMPDGIYSMSRHVSPQTRLPMIDTAGDTGKFVGAILADPEKYEGKTFCAATKLYTMEEQAAILSKYTGKKVVYRQIPDEMFKSFLLPGPYADVLMEMRSYQQDFGYYGAQTEELVKWASANARGKLTTFEEYLEKNPLVLD